MYQSSPHGVAPATLPKPVGYKLLVYVPDVKEKTSGGIFLPQNTADREKTASIVCQVLALGSSAYLDADKFQAGPLCKEGDWVMFHAYTGTRFKVSGKDFRLINDDSVEAVVEDPGSVERA